MGRFGRTMLKRGGDGDGSGCVVSRYGFGGDEEERMKVMKKKGQVERLIKYEQWSRLGKALATILVLVTMEECSFPRYHQ